MAKKRILSDEEKTKIKQAKKELKQYQNNIRYITAKLNETEEIRAVLEKVTTILTPGKSFTGGESPDRFADGISKIEELRGKLSKRTIELMEIKFEVEDKIDSLPYPYRDILFYKYTKNMSWREIAGEINYDIRYLENELYREAIYLYSKK